MAILPHALAALVLGNFRLASFFERAHSGFRIREPDSTIECAVVQLTSLPREQRFRYGNSEWETQKPLGVTAELRPLRCISLRNAHR